MEICIRVTVEINNRVIAVTGTPGVGKSSTSKMLASKLGAMLISLGELVEKEKLYSEVDEKSGSLIPDIKRLSKRLREIISNSKQGVVIEGHYSVDVLPKSKVHLVFVLRRHPEELKTILEGRGFRGEKLWENLMAEILDVCLWEAVRRHGTQKVCEIDVTGRILEDIVEDMIATINNKGECKTGFVDWLGQLEAEGKIDEYLKSF